jgi:hypothetical protein
MKGYPKEFLIKQDYVNLLSMPEYAKQAKSDLLKLIEIEDSKVTTDRGTNEKSDLVEIDNPMPAWKIAGFKDRDGMITLSAKY